MVSFIKGERKDEVTQRYLVQFKADEGVLYVGRAQEKAPGDPAWLSRTSGFVP